MNFKAVLLTALYLTIILHASSADNNNAFSTDMPLVKFIIQLRDSLQGASPYSLACFQYYTDLFNQIAEEYKKQYGDCIAISEQAKDQLNDEVQANRTKIEEKANDSCQDMADCNDLQDAEAYFECYASVSSKNAQVMYAISSESSKNLLHVRDKNRRIDYDQDICTTNAERQYEEKTNETNEELQKCLSGEIPVPTTTTTTEATADKARNSNAIDIALQQKQLLEKLYKNLANIKRNLFMKKRNFYNFYS